MPSIKSVHLPYRGVISSQELQGYFNSILSDIQQLEDRVKHIESTLSHGYVYGCRLEYDHQTKVLTVHDGFFVWHGDIKFVTKIVANVTLRDGDIVHIDPEQGTGTLTIQNVVLQNQVPLGQYVNQQFTYAVRKQLQLIDATQQSTRLMADDIAINSAGGHLDIGFSMKRMNIQMYSQAKQQWMYIARPSHVKSQSFDSTTVIPVEGLILFQENFVFGDFAPNGVIFSYRSGTIPTNAKLCLQLNGVTYSEAVLEHSLKTIHLQLDQPPGYHLLQVRIMRNNGAQAGQLPAGFQYSLFLNY